MTPEEQRVARLLMALTLIATGVPTLSECRRLAQEALDVDERTTVTPTYMKDPA